MATKHQEMQRIIRYYREVTGKTEVDMKEVARFALSKGLQQLPTPVDPLDRLASEFSQAAREEVNHDEKTGRPYRVNHVFSHKQGNLQFNLWIDIHTAPRKHIQKSLVKRREQMVSDGLQLTFDADFWNSINPNEEPINIPMDFTEDIEERKNAPNEWKKAV